MQLLYVYAFLQIIFEALPVSSSGNVLLWTPVLQNLLQISSARSVLPDFDFLLHIPTLFVLALFFFREWIPFVIRIRKYKRTIVLFALRCLLADAITTAFYFFWKAEGTAFFPLWVGFLCTTIMLLSLYFYKGKNLPKVFTYKDAALWGIVQGFALLPGVSRLASTFVAGVWMGYSYEQSFRYSFLLQIPLIGCAALKGLWEVYKKGGDPLLCDSIFYVIVCVASVVAFCLLLFLSGMVKRKSVWKFAWYTAVLSIIAAWSSR